MPPHDLQWQNYVVQLYQNDRRCLCVTVLHHQGTRWQNIILTQRFAKTIPPGKVSGWVHRWAAVQCRAARHAPRVLAASQPARDDFYIDAPKVAVSAVPYMRTNAAGGQVQQWQPTCRIRPRRCECSSSPATGTTDQYLERARHWTLRTK